MEERQLDSPIYNTIDEIEEYISNCKGRFMSSTDIIVNRDIIEEYLRELKRKAPEEIAKCRRIISNQEKILNDAKERAQNLIDQTMQQTDQLISQNEIMRRAYDQADEVIKMAEAQAQNIVDSAVIESNEIRNAASQYMEDVMVYLENTFDASSKAASDNYNALINTLDMYSTKVKEDHKQLHAEPEVREYVEETSENTTQE